MGPGVRGRVGLAKQKPGFGAENPTEANATLAKPKPCCKQQGFGNTVFISMPKNRGLFKGFPRKKGISIP